MKIYQKSSTGSRISEFEVASIKIQIKKHKEKRIKKINRVCSQTFRAKKKKQSKCIPINEWINKIWHIYTMGVYKKE